MAKAGNVPDCLDQACRAGLSFLRSRVNALFGLNIHSILVFAEGSNRLSSKSRLSKSRNLSHIKVSRAREGRAGLSGRQETSD